MTTTKPRYKDGLLDGYVICGYKITDYLGAGTYGKVFMAHATTPETRRESRPYSTLIGDIAIKISLDTISQLSELTSSVIGRTILNELFVLQYFSNDEQLKAISEKENSPKSFPHPNIATIIKFETDCFQPPSRFIYFLPLARYDMAVFLKKPSALWHESFSQHINIGYEIACGLKYIHDKSFVHLDLKPANILIFEEKTTTTIQVHARINDFGFTRSILANTEGQYNQVASLWYRDPVLLCGARRFGQATDVWSTGLILLELNYLWNPFYGIGSEADMIYKIKELFGYPKRIVESLEAAVIKGEDDEFESLAAQDCFFQFDNIKEQEDEAALHSRTRSLRDTEEWKTKYSQMSSYTGRSIMENTFVWKIIDACLQVDPQQRATINGVVEQFESYFALQTKRSSTIRTTCIKVPKIVLPSFTEMQDPKRALPHPLLETFLPNSYLQGSMNQTLNAAEELFAQMESDEQLNLYFALASLDIASMMYYDTPILDDKQWITVTKTVEEKAKGTVGAAVDELAAVGRETQKKAREALVVLLKQLNYNPWQIILRPDKKPRKVTTKAVVS